MSVPTFQLGSFYDDYVDTYSGSYFGKGTNGYRATRNATVSNHNTLTKSIAANHASEFKNAYEYIEDGNIAGFQSVIDGIQANESAKQRTYNITDSEIQTAIEDAYQQVIGADYDLSIAGTKKSSFASGFNSAFSWLTGEDTTSAAEYQAQRRGTKVNAQEQANKNLGTAAGTATLVGTTAAVGTTIACLANAGFASTVGAAIAAVCPYLIPVALGIGAIAFIKNLVASK